MGGIGNSINWNSSKITIKVIYHDLGQSIFKLPVAYFGGVTQLSPDTF